MPPKTILTKTVKFIIVRLATLPSISVVKGYVSEFSTANRFRNKPVCSWRCKEERFQLTPQPELYPNFLKGSELNQYIYYCNQKLLHDFLVSDFPFHPRTMEEGTKHIDMFDWYPTPSSSFATVRLRKLEDLHTMIERFEKQGIYSVRYRIVELPEESFSSQFLDMTQDIANIPPIEDNFTRIYEHYRATPQLQLPFWV